MPGLSFLAFQQHPETQFVRVQNALAGVDALNEYIKHVGSAIFAVPVGSPRARRWATPCSPS